MFPTLIKSLQTTRIQQYIACVTEDCCVYLVDIVCMRVLKVYMSSYRKYNVGLYIGRLDVLWLVDLNDELCVLSFDDRKTSGKRIKVLKNCIDMKLIDDSVVFIYNSSLYIINELSKVKDELQGQFKSVKGLEGRLITGGVINKTNVVFISNEYKAYIISLNDLYNKKNSTIIPKNVITLKEFNATKDYHFIIFNEYLFAIHKQTFYSWNLLSHNPKPSLQKPWKPFKTKPKLRTNPHLNEEHKILLEDNEIITCNLVYSDASIKSILYIIATNKGHIYIIDILINYIKTYNPIIKVACNVNTAINCLYAKSDKLLAAFIDGSVSIIDISYKKLRVAYENMSLIRSGKDCYYKSILTFKELLIEGIDKFIEVNSLSNSLSLARIVEEFSKDIIGIADCTNNLYLLSLRENKIVYRWRGHDDKIKGIYLNEVVKRIVAVSKKGTGYIYDIATGALERITKSETTYDILDLEERVDKYLTREKIDYDELFKICERRDIVLKRGFNRTLDFLHYENTTQTDWRIPLAKKEIFCKLLYHFETDNVKDKEMKVKLFNKLSNYMSKLKGKKDKLEISFTSIKVKLGNTKIQSLSKNELFQGNFRDINKSSVIILNLENLVEQLKTNYKGGIKSPKLDSVHRKDMLKVDASNKVFGRFLNVTNFYQKHSNILWPLPLISLIHCFGLNKKLDKELADELCVGPPLLELWPGVLGVENSLSFAVPEDVNNFNWKISPSLNSAYCMTLFGSLISAFQSNEQLISSLISKLLTFISQLLLTKDVQCISFMELSGYLASTNIDIWSTSRDIILQPLLKKVNIELLKNLAIQLGQFIEVLYCKIKEDPSYYKTTEFFKEKQSLVKFDFFSLINKYFGLIELKVVSLLCYFFNVHKEALVPSTIIKKCVKLICLVIAYSLNTIIER